MPRRGRRGPDEERRQERTQVFEKTKMCKFHLLGNCLRGDDCHFAHTKEDLHAPPDLARTKLCKTLIETGMCNDPECTYAHDAEELRTVPGFSPAAAAAPPRQDPPRPVAKPFAGSKERTKGISQNYSQPSQMSQTAMNAQRRQWESTYQMPMGIGMGGAAAIFAPILIPGNLSANGAAPMMTQAALRQQMMAFQADMPQAQHMDADSKSATLLQMNQAAQAHAAEALRLQAMASCLQAQGTGCSGATGGRGFGADASDMGFGPCSYVVQNPAGWPYPADKGGCGNEEGKTLRSSGMMKASGVPRSSSGVGLASDDDAPQKFSPTEPAQIPLGSLRSLSSQSLPVEPDSEDQSGGYGNSFGAPTTDLRVKNTFLDFDARTPLAGRLRPVFSAAGRLDALAEDDDKGHGNEHDASIAQQVSSSSGARSVGRFPSGAPTDAHSEAAANLVGFGLGDMLGANIKVKNTFLDFATEDPPVSRLRAVHTAAGRLDLLGDE